MVSLALQSQTTMNVIFKASVKAPCYDTPATNVAKKGVEMTAINYLGLKNFGGRWAPQGCVLIKLSASFSKLYSINSLVRVEQLIFFTNTIFFLLQSKTATSKLTEKKY